MIERIFNKRSYKTKILQAAREKARKLKERINALKTKKDDGGLPGIGVRSAQIIRVSRAIGDNGSNGSRDGHREGHAGAPAGHQNGNLLHPDADGGRLKRREIPDHRHLSRSAPGMLLSFRVMNLDLILALDIGTSSTRTAIFDVRAGRLAGTAAQQSYPLITSADGGAELDPPVLLGAVWHCIEQTMRAYRADATLRGRPIAASGVSCFWHSLLGCDARGLAITRIFTWADARCRVDAAALRKEFSEKETHARTGCMLRSSFWPAKLRWLRRVNRRKFLTARQWMSPAEWLQITLAGDASCAVAMATATGLFNPMKLAWDPPLMKACGVTAAQMRPVSDEPTPIGGRLAAQFPELKGVPWFPGIGDGAASNLGCGATRPGVAAINVGTSAAVRVVCRRKGGSAPFGLTFYRLDAERFLLVGAMSNAGNLRAWCVREFHLKDDPALEAELAKRPGPAHGLIVLPFWTDERAPIWNEGGTGTIHGITLHTTALDLLQAVTEATYHHLARIVELILTAEKSPPKFIVSGGIQRSPAALQRLADVLGQTIHPNDEMEASIRGAAIYALEKLGYPAPDSTVGKPVKPRMKYAKLYAAEREKQRALEVRG